jgi:hypothetical protein
MATIEIVPDVAGMVTLIAKSGDVVHSTSFMPATCLAYAVNTTLKGLSEKIGRPHIENFPTYKIGSS